MKLLVLIACLAEIHAFLDFFKSASTSASNFVEVSRPYPKEFDHFRGVPPNSIEKYKQATLTCDNGRKISSASINDGYCDCFDGTDEPGTSACVTGKFYCSNPGYKPLTLTSSRVDDGICDCCDGSDEGIFVKCSNTCDEMAESEKASLNRALNTFKVGNQLRKLWEDTARTQLEQEASQVPDPTVATNLKHQIDHYDAAIQQKEADISALEAKIETDVKAKIFRLLKVSADPSHYQYLAHFLSSLTKALHFDEIQLNNYLTDQPVKFSEHQHQQHEDEEVGDDYEFIPDTLSSPPSGTDEPHSHEESQDAAATPASPACDLVEITKNDHLHVICASHTTQQAKQDAMLSIFFSVIKDNGAYYETMLLLGYYRLYQTWDNADGFVTNHIQASGQDSCPSEFSSLGANHCEIKELLRDFYQHTANNEEKKKLETELRELREAKQKLTNELHALENVEETMRRAQENLHTYADLYQFYSLKGQCVDVEDGKFSYSVCMLQDVKQKEIGGYNNVLLGNYDKIEESTEYGHSYKMKFTNGQHCHAFGARTADVTIICGDKNVLKSAQEPSTCYYSLLMESPAACTEKYAIANGLQV